MNNKPQTMKWKKWMSKYMKNHPNSGQFKKGHKNTKKQLLKIVKALKIAHKLYPEKWKRSDKEKKLMSLRMKKYIIEHPNFIKKQIKAMQKANRKRKYPRKTLQEKIKFTKFIKEYFKTHNVWNKGLKTGLIPKTAFKKGQIPYNKYLPSYLQSAWKGGLSFEPYPLGWTKIFKEQIRKRDNFTCQKCNKKQSELKGFFKKLHVHHIDYNKQNCKENNLITLCSNCHRKTNTNRDYWFAYFKYIMEN